MRSSAPSHRSSDIQTGFLYASLLFQTLRLSSFPGLMRLVSSIHPGLLWWFQYQHQSVILAWHGSGPPPAKDLLLRVDLSPLIPLISRKNGRLTSIPIRDPARISVLPSGNLNFLGPDFARFPLGRSENLAGSRIRIQHTLLTLELKMSTLPLLFTLGFILETSGWGQQHTPGLKITWSRWCETNEQNNTSAWPGFSAYIP